MWRLGRGIGFLALLVVLTAVFFTIYAHFLVDYSLDNLGLALEVTAEKNAKIEAETPSSPISDQVYRNVVQDLVLDEASREDVDFKSLALLELASRSLNQAIEKAGYSRAKIYLTEVARNKEPDRSSALRVLDKIYVFLRNIYRSILSVFQYLKRLVTPDKEESFEISSHILLSQAEEQERTGHWKEAANIYRKYLKLYPNREESSFVSISMGYLMIRLKEWDEAEKVFSKIQREYAGSKEAEIADTLLRKIGQIKKRYSQIDRLNEQIASSENDAARNKMQFQLALAYLSVNDLSEAQQAFKKLEAVEDKNLRQKSKFYIGWIYKMQFQYDKGAQVWLSLLEDKEIDRQLQMGLEAQLADIYYQKKDTKTALEHYKNLSSQAREELLARQAAVEAWIGLAEIEQGVIYYFDIGDQVQGGRVLENVGEVLSGQQQQFVVLRKELEDSSQLNLRDLAFKQLRKRRLSVAMDLFKRNLILQPEDGWTHAGIATIYLLYSDLKLARDFGEKAYHLQNDEYTSSVLGYVFGFLEKYKESIGYYKEAVGRNPDYIPARYNLACMHLKIKEYAQAKEVLLGLDKSFEAVQNPMRSKVLNNLGYTLWWMGERPQAIERFKQALQVTPGFVDAKKNLDQIALGQMPSAVNLKPTLNLEEV